MPDEYIIYDPETESYYRLAYTGPEVDEALGRILRQKKVSYVANGYIGFEIGWAVQALGRTVSMTHADEYVHGASRFDPPDGDPAGSFLDGDPEGVEDDGDYIKENQDLVEGEDESSNLIPLPDFEAHTVGSSTNYVCGPIELPLDMPIKFPVITGSIDRDDITIIRTNYTPTRVSFYLLCPYNPTHNSAVDHFVIRMMLSGRRRTPEVYPPWRPISNDANATKRRDNSNLGLLDVAKTYLTARENGRAFAYGKNFTYGSTNLVNDSSGRALMECDTLITMAMLGVPYGYSPYGNTNIDSGIHTTGGVTYGTPSFEYHEYDLPSHRSDRYEWAAAQSNFVVATGNPAKYDNGLNRLITNTSAQNWWFWDNDMVFTDIDSVRSGDFAVLRRADSTQYDGISHIGIIEVVNNEKYFIHVSSQSYTPDGCIVARVKFTQEDYYTPYSRYAPEDTYFIRPNSGDPTNYPIYQYYGYPTGYIVHYTDGNNYRSKVDNNTCQPTVDPSGESWEDYWEVVE